jgi:hypothetical protein
MSNRFRLCLGVTCLFAILAPADPARVLAGALAPEPVTVPAVGGIEPVAAGLIMNGRSNGDLIVYRTENEYWIPYTVFIDATGLKESGQPGQRTGFATSVGTLHFDKGELKVFEKEPYISFSSLRRAFLVKAVFDQHLFAATLDIPWSASLERKQGKNLPPPVPDVPAPSGSLSFLSFDTGIQRDFHGLSSNTLQVQAGGRLLHGVWDVDSEGDPARTMELKRYHWTIFSENVALRLGTGTNLISPETVNNDFTGVQIGWNNRSLLDYLDSSGRSSTDIFISANRNLFRTIEGQGPAAGVAELRFDGKIVARRRIRLDGRFAFENVRMGSDLRKAEVYIYERSPMEKPVAILDYTQSVMNGSLPGGEMLMRGGYGRAGNPLTTKNSPAPDNSTGYAQVQYGLNDRITIDTAVQYNPVTSLGEYSAGSIVSLGKNWGSSIYRIESNRSFGTDLRIEGHGRGWTISYLSQWNDHDFGFNGAPQQTEEWLRFGTTPYKNISMLLYGRKTLENGIETRRFLLPGAYVSPWRTMRLSAVPNESGHFRYEADQTFSSTSFIRAIHETGIGSIEWDKNLRENLSARLLYEYAFKTRKDLSGFYLDWYPKNSRFNLLEIGGSRANNEYGFTGKWIRYVNTGLKMALQYSWNMTLAQNLVTTNEYSEFLMPPISRHFFGCTISWDLGFSGIRPFPIDRNAITTTRGGLAGKLGISGDTRVSSSDINDVGILLDGRRLDQRQVDGSFFVGNLRPGLYTVSIDTENLPIELSTDSKKLLVEVRNGAVTNVNFAVHAMYGIDGRLVDAKGNGIGNGVIELLDAKQAVVATVSTNEFGDYRTDGLPGGIYNLRVVSVAGRKIENIRTREIRVNGDYLNGVDLNIGESPAPVADGTGSSETQAPAN